MKITKEDRTEFKGKPNGSPTIKDGKVVAPNLFKMGARDLQKWERILDRHLGYFSLSVKTSPVHKEYYRIHRYIYSHQKTIILTDKDFIDYIRYKRDIGKDIVIDGVAICCGEAEPGHKISVEYYSDGSGCA